jgi:hypothetical protein
MPWDGLRVEDAVSRLRGDPRLRRLVGPAGLRRLWRTVTERVPVRLDPRPEAARVEAGVSAPGKAPYTGSAVGPWDGCDPIPTRGSGCGWTLRGHLARLVDPNDLSCDDAASGITTGGTADLGWWLSAGSTCTVRLADGRQRIYMHSPSLATLCGEADVLWPYQDARGASKFGVTVAGSSVIRVGDAEGWWSADADAVTDPAELHFSSRYIAWMDAEDDGTFTLIAPELAPNTSADEGECWADVTPTFDTSLGRAGWHSTDIPFTGASTVYRDVSVCYLAGPGAGLYVLVCVECSSDTFVEGEDPGCSICTPGACTDAGTPTTRLVYFASTSPDFNESTAPVAGPFALFAPEDQPDADVGEWLGVPQALVDPGGEYMFVMVNKNDADGALLYAARVSDVLVQVFVQVIFGEGTASVFHDHLAGGGYAGSAVEGRTPSSGYEPTVTDPHLLFGDDGLAHLFYANRYSGSTADPLDLLSSAHALLAYSPDFVGGWLDGTEDMLEAIGIMLTVGAVFALVPGTCDPLCLSEVLRPVNGCHAYRGGYGAGDLINDPDVFLSLSGDYQATFHSGVLGGLVYATASASRAFR